MSARARCRAQVSSFLAALLLACGAGGEAIAPPTFVVAWGASGEEPGALSQPTGIAVAADGTVFVADTGNHRIQAFAPDGSFLRGFGSEGRGAGQFLRPMDLDVGSDGLLYVAEFGGDRIQVFRQDGELVRTLAPEDNAVGPLDGAAGVLAAPDGSVFVADFYGGRVLHFRRDGGVAQIGAPGRVLAGRLHYPTDLEWLDGRLVVADAYNHRIQLFDAEGRSVARWGGPLGLGLPGARPGWFRVATGVASDAKERLYVADFENHRIQVFSSAGELLLVFGSRGAGRGQFERPTDLDVGPDGRIYVVDFGNDRIQVFTPLARREP